MFKYSKISNYKVKKILLCFANNLTATETSKLEKLNRTTINKYYHLFRELIYEYTEHKVSTIKNLCIHCCGFFSTEYGDQCYYNMYKIEDLYFAAKSNCSRTCCKMALTCNLRKEAYFKNFDRVTKFFGISKNTHYLHVIESVYRINFNEEKIYSLLLKMISNYSKKNKLPILINGLLLNFSLSVYFDIIR